MIQVRTILAAGMVLLFGASSAFGMTYLDHLKKSNEVLCKVALSGKCKAQLPPKGPKDQKGCVTQLNAMSSANPQNAKINVNASKSAACIKHLESTKGCMMELMGASIKGKCSSGSLK